MIRRSLPAAALAAATSWLAAQEPPRPPVFTSGAEVVIVDVVVTDDRGRPVRGLTREDFVVHEDGAAQPLTFFESIDRPAEVAPAPEPDAGAPVVVASNDHPAAERATVVVVFDELHLSPLATEMARQRLREAWGRGSLGPADLLLASTAGGGAWQGRLPEDADALQAALGRFKGVRPATDPARMTDYDAFLIAARHDERVLIEVYRRYLDQRLIPDPTMPEPKGMRGRQSDASAQLPAMGRSAVVSEAEARWETARKRQAAALASLTRLLSGLSLRPGRKAVLLVSEGFVHDPAVLEHRDLVEAARRARASVHLVDPRGGGVTGHEVEFNDRLDERDVTHMVTRQMRTAEGSNALAHATGGRITRNLPGLNDALGRIGAELRTYYLLGYAPPGPDSDGRYHKLRVEVKRPGLKLEARPGYFAVAPPEKRAARESVSGALQAALDSPFDAGVLPVRMASFVLGPARSGSATVRLVAEVEAPRAAAADAEPPALDAVFQLVARGRNQAQQSTLAVPAAGAKGPLVRLEAQFEAPPGAYQARLAVRERGGERRLGSVRQAVEVLPEGAFRLTTPILTDVLLQDRQPLARAERRFPRDATLHCLVEVLGAAAGAPLKAGVDLRSPDGRVHLSIPATPLASVPRTRQWSIPLAGLSPGSYELLISVQDLGKGEGLQVRERFEVVL
jgi:VWFA-related protein